MHDDPAQPFDRSTKIDILKHVQSLQMDEVHQRRAREHQIFTWTSGLLVALIGALLVFPRTTQTVWGAYGFAGRLLATVAVAIFVVHSILWQYRNRMGGRQNARVVVRINQILHLFDPRYYDSASDEPVLPAGWQLWGESTLETSARTLPAMITALLFGANFIMPTFLIGLVTILMIWAT